MSFISVLFILLFIFIFISLYNTLIYFSCKLVTQHSYTDINLFIPSLLSIITWCISFFSMYILIEKNTNKNISDFITTIIFKSDNIFNYNILLPIMLITILTIIIQAFVLLTINIDYKKINNKFIYNIKKIISKFKNFDIINNNSLTVIDTPYILTYLNSFTICLFVFSITFFLTSILYVTGTYLSSLLF